MFIHILIIFQSWVVHPYPEHILELRCSSISWTYFRVEMFIHILPIFQSWDVHPYPDHISELRCSSISWSYFRVELFIHILIIFQSWVVHTYPDHILELRVCIIFNLVIKAEQIFVSHLLLYLLWKTYTIYK